ncbi:MAG TPA: DNA/RNA non-specific endonuclease [Planctomycetaceae bacterium]|jgi:endonuclease G|nr:DNA/RNA non-specific endonuclease [Planctomycetaceae bacterium]
MRLSFTRTLIASLLCLAIATPIHALAQSEGKVNSAMGNPTKADESDKDNYLMEKKYFTLSYNNSKGIPNWVSWHVDKSDLGNAPRFSFKSDNTLPEGFNKVTTKDYTNGGFDRGHMCPHSDRAATNETSKATFVMTNIIPQTAEVNRKAWAQLEEYCRRLVLDENKELYIISGPQGKGGRGANGFRSSLSHGKVVVPAHCWKVIMVLDAKDGDDVKRVDQDARLIAVVMPTNREVGEEWAPFRVSVKDVEELTGFTFFGNVDPDVLKESKLAVDDEEIETQPPIIHARRRPRSDSE